MKEKFDKFVFMDEKSAADKKLAADIDALIAKAKASKNHDVKFTLKSGNSTFLTKVIKTQEQADFFMHMLEYNIARARKK